MSGAFVDARDAAARIAAAMGSIATQCAQMTLALENRKKLQRVIEEHLVLTAPPRDAASIIAAVSPDAPVTTNSANAIIEMDAFGQKLQDEHEATRSAAALESLNEVRAHMARACPAVANALCRAVRDLGRSHDSITVLQQASLLPAAALYGVLCRWDANRADFFKRAYIAAAREHYYRAYKRVASATRPAKLVCDASETTVGRAPQRPQVSLAVPSPVVLSLLCDMAECEASFSDSFFKSESDVSAIMARAGESFGRALRTALAACDDVCAALRYRRDLCAACSNCAVALFATRPVDERIDALLVQQMASLGLSRATVEDRASKAAMVCPSTVRLATLLMHLVACDTAFPGGEQLVDAHARWIEHCGANLDAVGRCAFAATNADYLSHSVGNGCASSSPVTANIGGARRDDIASLLARRARKATGLAADAILARVMPAMASLLDASADESSPSVLAAAAHEASHRAVADALARAHALVYGPPSLTVDLRLAEALCAALADRVASAHATFVEVHDAAVGKRSVSPRASRPSIAAASRPFEAMGSADLADLSGTGFSVGHGMAPSGTLDSVDLASSGSRDALDAVADAPLPVSRDELSRMLSRLRLPR